MSKRGWLLVRDAPLARFSSVTLAALTPPGFQAGGHCHPDYRGGGPKVGENSPCRVAVCRVLRAV